MQETHLWDEQEPVLPSVGYLPEALIYDDWEEFSLDWGDLNPEDNYLVSFVWNDADDPEQEIEKDVFLAVFYLGGKGVLRFTETFVTKEDEPKVKKFLEKHAEYIGKVWKINLK